MSGHARHILLINPTITSRRGARFPLSLLALATSIATTSIPPARRCHDRNSTP
jgi:hypothetical protein